MTKAIYLQNHFQAHSPNLYKNDQYQQRVLLIKDTHSKCIFSFYISTESFINLVYNAQHKLRASWTFFCVFWFMQKNGQS
ncbi:MAG: hypothetical protein D3903_06635 [Candidatus Electrothrix sp. GM3_4]|nr:hypothetical protein [Candidatus Electrothrix sp. GM3_4]